MKTIMISIYKKHNENIFDTLLKTEEIRKNRPKIDLPFKAVVYEPKKHGGCGKVVGEFVVDRIEQFDSAFSEYAYAVAPRDINCIMPMSEDKAIQLMTTKGCLTLEDTIDYFGDEDYVAYFWHITAPKRYDKPKELGEFRKPCGNCIGKCTGEHYDRCPWRTITRPPQSYMRIQDTKEERK